LTWISWFCSLPGHEYFCEVSEDFIEDDFNLTGLNTMVPFWKEAMEMVLDVEPGVGFFLCPNFLGRIARFLFANKRFAFGTKKQRTKIRPRFLTYPLWSLRPRCCMDLCISGLY
jgi:hypothetical protein